MNKVNRVHKIDCKLIYLFFKRIDINLPMSTHFTMCRYLYIMYLFKQYILDVGYVTSHFN